MKFLNTKYPALFDTSLNCSSSSTYNVIYNTYYYNQGYCTKNIVDMVTTTSIYVKFSYNINFNDSSNFALIANIQIVGGGPNILVYDNPTQMKITTYTDAFTWVGDVPARQSTWPESGYHQRDILIHWDTAQNLVELYSDGIQYASVTCANNGETIRRLLLGALDPDSYKHYTMYFGSLIISDLIILPTESVTEVTPTVTSTDWTVSSGVASADNVGDTMTLTIPSGSIDETRKDVTGYGVAFLNCTPAETINAVTVAQSGTTKQVVLPSGSVETADTFAVSSASDVSALVTAAYV